VKVDEARERAQTRPDRVSGEQARVRADMALLRYALVLAAQNSVGRIRVVGPWHCAVLSLGGRNSQKSSAPA
jgi:hypothetical protein